MWTVLSCPSISELINSSRKKFDFNKGRKWFHDDKHERIHYGEKSYEYNKNENGLCLNEDSVQHQKIQILEQPFEYNECRKAFHANSLFVKLKKPTQDKTPVNTLNTEKPVIFHLSLLKEHIQKRITTNLMNVEKISLRTPFSLNIVLTLRAKSQTWLQFRRPTQLTI